MTRERYELFLELKREIDTEIEGAKGLLHINDCCKPVDYTSESVELEGSYELCRGGGTEYVSGTIPAGYLIEEEKKAAYAAEALRLIEVVATQARQAQTKLDVATKLRHDEYIKLKEEFDGPTPKTNPT
jgi:hypothetical protein